MKPDIHRPRGAALLLLAAAMIAVAPATETLAGSKAPLGYQVMCLKTPSECRGGGEAVAKGGAKTIALLERVNNAVNARIAPRADRSADSWSPNAKAGDCEEFVLAKRRALLKAGIAASAIRIAYVQTSAGVGHAVLVVRTTTGDFVLDNLNGAVRPMARLGYRVVSMSGSNPMDWS